MDEFDRLATAGAQWHSWTLYCAFDERDWHECVELANSLGDEWGVRLRTILERVRVRTDDRFAMVVWSVQDILNAVARYKDPKRHDLDEASWDDAGVSREWVEDVMIEAGSQMSDRMTERGWDVLEEVISQALPDEV